MAYDTSLSEDTAEQAIVERLFRASMDVECALSMVGEERTAVLLRQVIDHLDLSIKHFQGRALGQQERPQRVDLPAPDLLEAVARVSSGCGIRCEVSTAPNGVRGATVSLVKGRVGRVPPRQVSATRRRSGDGYDGHGCGGVRE